MKLYNKLFIFTLLIVIGLPKIIFAWNLNTASYDSVYYSVAAQDTFTQDFYFRSDGTKMYIVGSSNDRIYQYSLSTAWDISTLVYDIKNFSVAIQSYDSNGIYFKSDGTKMYILSRGYKSIYQYSLSSAWDVSTATYDSISFFVSDQESAPRALFFSDNGLKMYITGSNGDKVNQYNLSVAWDLSSATTIDSTFFSIAAQEGMSTGLFFQSNGARMYVAGTTTDSVYQYTLSSPWDVSTAAYDSISKNIFTETGSVSGLQFKSDGSKMYIINSADGTIHQYSVDTNPTVNSFSPADNVDKIMITANLVITFSEAVDVESGNIYIKKSSDDSTWATIDVSSGQVTGTGTNTITINPTDDMPNQTAYYVQIDATAFDDVGTNSYAGIADKTTWNFTVGDITNPTVSSFSPADNSTSVAVDSNLVINFDEAVDAETGNIYLYKNNNTLINTFNVATDISGTGTSAITINPAENLQELTGYYLKIDATAFDDPTGNSYAGVGDVTTWNFTTAGTSGATVSVISGNTTEAGGTAIFTVKLNTEPTADVTIPVSSSDTTEGTVSADSLTFTSTNWGSNQTITVTGVNDDADDGDIVYNIVLGTATSADTNYNNINLDDLSLTNLDDDIAILPEPEPEPEPTPEDNDDQNNNGIPDEYEAVDPLDSAAVANAISSVSGATNGQITVIYKNAAQTLLTIFSNDISSSNTVIKQINSTGYYAVINSVGNIVAISNVLNGAVSSTKQISTKTWTKNIVLKTATMRSKSWLLVLTKNSQNKVLFTIMKISNSNSLSKKDAENFTSKPVKLSKTKTEGNYIIFKSKKKEITKYLLTKKSKLKKIF